MLVSEYYKPILKLKRITNGLFEKIGLFLAAVILLTILMSNSPINVSVASASSASDNSPFITQENQSPDSKISENAVMAVDVIPPVITILGRNPVTSLRVGSVMYKDAGAIATDNVDGNLTASILVNNPVNTSVAGTYTVTYSVTDAANNTGTATRTVIVSNPLDPVTIPKFQDFLIIPPEMPKTTQPNPAIDYYEIATREFQEQVLPTGMPQTTVWGYGSATTPGTFNAPSFTIETTANRPVRVKWINDLVDQNGNYLPFFLPVDQTLHWANPAAGIAGRDSHGTDPTTYVGPVPIVTHVHGAHAIQEGDGHPEAWFLPAANNIPAGYATTGTYYDIFKTTAPSGASWGPGNAVFDYPNNQRASTIWYHDHALGVDRLNVMQGPAGFWLIRGGADDINLGFNRPGQQLFVGVNPAEPITEIPIAIQDRSFNDDGSIFYPDSRALFDGFTGPYAPISDIAPIWNPEFFGDSMMVNGRTWPYLNVEQKQYRLRFLNGDNSRFLILQMDNGMNFTQIGAEGGFLASPAMLNRLLLGGAERADVIVNFTNIPVGTNITLQNVGPDEPFGGGVPCPIGQDPITNPGCGDFAPANPATTGRVMQFRVVAATTPDTSTPADQITLPPIVPLGAENKVRNLSLNEECSNSSLTGFQCPKAALLGTVMFNATTGAPMGMPMMWGDAVTENVTLGDTEIWDIYDFTVDAHPIHLHQVMFQVVNREVFDPAFGVVGTITLPEPGETGWKDTVIAYPGQITRIKARWDIAGLYVWHCHILEHEENEMMRPYTVSAPPVVPKLNITATPTTVTVGVPTNVNFTVTDGVTPVSNAAVTLSGNATGTGTTNVNGNVVISVNATAQGTITSTATSTGYTDGTTTLSAIAPPVTIQNLIKNPGFESGKTPWLFYTNGVGTFNVWPPAYAGNNSARLAFSTAGTNMQLYQQGVALEPNTRYQLSFAAYSNTGHDIRVRLLKQVTPYTPYGLDYTANLGTSWAVFTTQFTTSGFASNVTDGRLQFWLVPFAKAGDTYYIDDVRLEKVSTAPVLPGIVTHPAGQTVVTGQTATFSVVATGTSLSYQWQKNGTDIAGATGASYTTPPATLADNGSVFRVNVTNSVGSVISNGAVLTVLPVTSINLIKNPGFESGKTSWLFYTNGVGTFSVGPPAYAGINSARIALSTIGTNMQLYQPGVALEPNTRYQLSFAAYSNTGHDIKVRLFKQVTPYTPYGLDYTANLGTNWAVFTKQFNTSGFTGNVTDARLQFYLIPFAKAGDNYYIDEVRLEKI